MFEDLERLAREYGFPLDPTTGFLGSIQWGGWIGVDPRDDTDVSFVYLATPGDGTLGMSASNVMPLVAQSLGFDPRPGSVTLRPAALVRLVLEPDGWATLTLDDRTLCTRPVPDDWRATAQTVGHIVVAIAHQAIPPGLEPHEHAETSADASIGLVTVSQR
jgi:Family of unknown function (DUF5949)